MLAIELSASSFCAREMRGTLSIASTVAFFAASCLQQLGVLRRPDEADQRAAFAHQADFVRARPAHLEDDVGRGPQPGRALDDLGARGAVDIVAEIRRIPGAGFDGDLEAELDELFDDFGHRGDAFLTGRRLFRHPYDLRHEFPF